MDQKDMDGIEQFERRVIIASDHAGFSVKNELIKFIADVLIYKVEDIGCYNDNRVDYPDYAHKLASKLLRYPGAFGILICGTGIGMSIVANRYKHIRAAVCHNIETAKLSRAHNDANVICLGARQLKERELPLIVSAFLCERFEGGRHENRIDKINNY